MTITVTAISITVNSGVSVRNVPVLDGTIRSRPSPPSASSPGLWPWSARASGALAHPVARVTRPGRRTARAVAHDRGDGCRWRPPPALLATGVAFAFADFLYTVPYQSFRVDRLIGLVGLLSFAGVAIIVSVFVHAATRASLRANPQSLRHEISRLASFVSRS